MFPGRLKFGVFTRKPRYSARISQLGLNSYATPPPKSSADVGIPLRVEVRRPGVLQRRKDHRAGAGLEEWVEVLEVQVEDVRSAELLLQRVDAAVGSSEDLVVLRVLLISVVQFECASWCQHVPVARQKAHRRACILLHAVSGDLGSKRSSGAYAHVLPALLRITGRRRQHQRAQQQHRLLHSSLDPFKFVRNSFAVPQATQWQELRSAVVTVSSL